VAQEHIDWDQAALLVQVGLLNPHGLRALAASEGKAVGWSHRRNFYDSW